MDFENQLSKKKKYISMQNLEKAADIKQFVLDLINKVKNSQAIDVNLFSNGGLERAWKDIFGGNVNVSIVDSSLFESGCKHRIDLEIEGQKDILYRIMLLSCDGRLKIQDIIKINKDMEAMKRRDAIKLFSTMFDINNRFIGNLMITSPSMNQIILTGKLNNLESYANKQLGIHIHSKGDINDKCKNCGMHYNPLANFHGGLSGERHLGDLGNISVDQNGVATINNVVELKKDLNVFSVMGSFAGRSIVLHDKQDDLGKGDNNESAITGNSGGRIACGVIGADFI